MPPRRTPQDEPTALDRLDPAPLLDRLDEVLGQPVPAPVAESPEPSRPAARRKGPVEAGVTRDLRLLPAQLRNGGIANAILRLARELDAGGLASRDAAGHTREIRQSLVTLAELAPGEGRGDRTDEIRDRRESNLRRRAAAGEQPA